MSPKSDTTSTRTSTVPVPVPGYTAFDGYGAPIPPARGQGQKADMAAYVTVDEAGSLRSRNGSPGVGIRATGEGGEGGMWNGAPLGGYGQQFGNGGSK